MTLTEIVQELENSGRCPALILEAHKKTLEALVALAERLSALENTVKPKK